MEDIFKLLDGKELHNYYLSCIKESTNPNFTPINYKTNNHQNELRNWLNQLYDEGGIDNVLNYLEKWYFFLEGEEYYHFPFSYWSEYEEDDETDELYGLILIPTPKKKLTLYSYFVSQLVGLHGIPFNVVETFDEIPQEKDLLRYL